MTTTHKSYYLVNLNQLGQTDTNESRKIPIARPNDVKQNDSSNVIAIV